MVFVNYQAGMYKTELNNLLRKRLSARRKIRFHNQRLKEYMEKVESIETEIDWILTITKRQQK